jgi:coenzyme F420-reducing hydrogenase beta subunit
MKDLYQELEIEREKLNELVTQALNDNRLTSSDEAIVTQSQKVDAILEKIAKQQETKKHRKKKPGHER